jgi:hypothetical protein
VRLITVSSIVAVLGLAGLAMAQDDLVVDPWKRAVNAVADPTAAPPVAERSAPRPVGVASFPIETPEVKPAVVPIGPPLAYGKDPVAVVPVGPPTHDEIFDPWARAAPGGHGVSRVASVRSGRDWAVEINEIIDPWSKGPLAAVTEPLIVDPWAQ